jgi:hypothetical protein
MLINPPRKSTPFKKLKKPTTLSASALNISVAYLFLKRLKNPYCKSLKSVTGLLVIVISAGFLETLDFIHEKITAAFLRIII